MRFEVRETWTFRDQTGVKKQWERERERERERLYIHTAARPVAPRQTPLRCSTLPADGRSLSQIKNAKSQLGRCGRPTLELGALLGEVLRFTTMRPSWRDSPWNLTFGYFWNHCSPWSKDNSRLVYLHGKKNCSFWKGTCSVYERKERDKYSIRETIMPKNLKSFARYSWEWELRVKLNQDNPDLRVSVESECALRKSISWSYFAEEVSPDPLQSRGGCTRLTPLLVLIFVSRS